MFVIVQVRIFRKWTKIKRKRQKRARDWKKHKITGSKIFLFGASSLKTELLKIIAATLMAQRGSFYYSINDQAQVDGNKVQSHKNS